MQEAVDGKCIGERSHGSLERRRVGEALAADLAGRG
jgi:hypothetical protein